MKMVLETNPQARCGPLTLVVTVRKSRPPTVFIFKNHKTFGFIKIGHITEKIMKENSPQARFLDENIAPQAKLMKKIAPQARFF